MQLNLTEIMVLSISILRNVCKSSNVLDISCRFTSHELFVDLLKILILFVFLNKLHITITQSYRFCKKTCDYNNCKPFGLFFSAFKVIYRQLIENLNYLRKCVFSQVYYKFLLFLFLVT